MSRDVPSPETIFAGAIEIESPAARAEFLDQACGADPELRRGVEQLVRNHFRAGRFLEEPAACLAPTADEPPAAERPGTVIGPYKLLELIGEGGMGAVWLAEQTRPIRRCVALKLIKPGMDSRQVLARFEAERQALALMDHPNIAHIHDGGTTADGRPFFVMELVKGIPITDYCDQCGLTTRERLDLFLSVCQAVQHAHQKGVIHRDLKPSNVLVAIQDGRPAAKVIDFGVAKAVNQRLGEQTLQTGFHQMIGTPLYMSPEQAELGPLDVDTRADMYALGVLLYELLTGTTPFERERLSQAGYDEIRRIIREEEPPRPSARLSTLQEKLTAVAAQRRTEPRHLLRMVKGELDWIVMKALEKDRNRRYETAGAFAADVQRYLADEPVLACPPSAGYRLRKFARRNKAALAVTGLVLAFLILMSSGLGWVVRDRAARQSRIAAQAEPILGDVDQLEREQKWPEALAAARRAEALVAGGGDAATQERIQGVVRDLQMVSRLEELRLQEVLGGKARAAIDENLPGLYAAVFRDFGVDIEALPAEDSAARLRARPVAIALAVALDDWARAGRLRAPDQSKRLWALAAAVDPDPWRVTVRRASAAMDVESLSKLASAPDAAQQPPQSQLLLASSLRLCGQPGPALDLLERACETHPSDFWVHFVLARLNTDARPARPEAALRHLMAARALRPGSAATWNNLSKALGEERKLDEAIASARRAVELDPNSAVAHNNLGKALFDKGRVDEAVPYLRKAVELDPMYAGAHNGLGAALFKQGKLDEAIAYARKAIELDPKDAVAHNTLGAALSKQGRVDEALTFYRKAIDLDPNDAHAHNNLGKALLDRGQVDEAVPFLRRATELAPKDALAHSRLGEALLTRRKLDEAIVFLRKAVELDPKHAVAHSNLGKALGDNGRVNEAVPFLRKAIELDPNYAGAHNNLGATLFKQGKLGEAITLLRRAIELDPKDAGAHSNLGAALARQKHLDEAVAHFRKAVELDPRFAGAHFNLGQALRDQKKLDEAVAAYRKVIELDPKNFAAYFWLGKAQESQGKLDEAIACFRKSVELDPTSPGAHYISLAWLLTNCREVKLRDPRGGLEVARKAVELAPRSASAWAMLGWAHYRTGDWKACIETLETSCDLDNPKGGDAGQWFFLAMAHWQLGEKDKAREWYARAAEWTDKHQPNNEDLRRFRAEAAELLELKEKK
jgi:eukaryotic-like serine/threonine-protein kinase